MPICVASTSVSAILQTPWNTACWSWHDVLVLFQNPAWQAQTDMAASLWVSWVKYQCRLRSSSWPFCSDSPEWRSRHMVTWFGHHGNAFGMTENAFFCAFITLRSQFHLHHCSQRALTEIVSKVTLTLDLSFKNLQWMSIQYFWLIKLNMAMHHYGPEYRNFNECPDKISDQLNLIWWCIIMGIIQKYYFAIFKIKAINISARSPEILKLLQPK